MGETKLSRRQILKMATIGGIAFTSGIISIGGPWIEETFSQEVGGRVYNLQGLKKHPQIFEKGKDEKKANPELFPARESVTSKMWRDKTKNWDGETEYYAVEADRDRRPQRLILPLDPEGKKVWVTHEKYWRWPTTKEIIPPDVFEEVVPPHVGPKELSEMWHEVVGLKATDLVGKIAPKIRPGMVTSTKELDNNLGLKKLLPSSVYMVLKGESFLKPFDEMEIVPTRELYLGYHWSRFSKENLKNCNVNPETYRLAGWKAGTPFPRPKSGLELAWNHSKKDIVGDSLRFAPMYWDLYGRDGGYERTYHFDLWYFRKSGRTHIKPMPEITPNKEGLFEWMINYFSYPQDVEGMTYYRARFFDPEKPDRCMAYIPSMRRIRRLSGTDVFDPMLGSDLIWEDFRSLWQKISKKTFPMEYKILETREYLMPSSAPYGYAKQYPKPGKINWCWERRPVYVVEAKALDPQYIYSKRILYLDMETFFLYYIENYDRKGRLYRTWLKNQVVEPESGIMHEDVTLIMDHINKHATVLHFTPSCCCKWIREGLVYKFFAERGR